MEIGRAKFMEKSEYFKKIFEIFTKMTIDKHVEIIKMAWNSIIKVDVSTF